MKRHVYVSTVALALALAGASIISTPLQAASEATDAFGANIRLQARFIIEASKLAQGNASSEKLKRAAASLVAEQTAIIAELDGRPAPEAGQMVADAGGEVATGRSVAAAPIDVSTFAPRDGVGVLLPAAAVSLDHLADSKSESFDALYTGLVRNVLTNLAGFYGAYARTGDDPALRAIAAREIPRLEADKLLLQ